MVERLIRYPCHTLLPIWRCGVVHCHLGTQKLTEVYEIYPELTGEVLAHDIHIVFLVYGSKNLQQMTKITFSSLLFVLEFMVRNITAFYSGQAIIWTNAGIALIGTLGTNFSGILLEIRIFSFKKKGLKVSSAKWRTFCLGLNLLTVIAT